MSRTPAERLNEILADFRAREPAAVPWLVEPAIRQVLAAWTRLPATLTVPLTIGGVPMHAHNRWKYAWKFRVLDVAALALEAGCSADEAASALDRLTAGRLIYPDGTLSEPARNELSSHP